MVRWAWDFALPIGTPIVAARDGIVAAAVDSFSGSGRRISDKPRANFVVVRHTDGTYSRYYHLERGSNAVRVGDSVVAGQTIARSGNTGFSSGPHLHFDVTDCISRESALFRVRRESGGWDTVECAAAAWCPALAPPDQPLQYAVAHACSVGDFAASVGAARGTLPSDCIGIALLVERGEKFCDIAAAAIGAGAVAVIVTNNSEGKELFSMAGSAVPLAIKALLVTRRNGELLRQRVAASAARGAPLVVQIAQHEHFVALERRRRRAEQPGCAALFSPDEYDTADERKFAALTFVAHSMPVSFCAARPCGAATRAQAACSPGGVTALCEHCGASLACVVPTRCSVPHLQLARLARGAAQPRRRGRAVVAARAGSEAKVASRPRAASAT
jgi:hypothetical protein